MAAKYNIPLTSILHKDQLKYITPKDGQSFIINMEDSNGVQGGTHWVALKIEKNDSPIYFDSLSAPPPCDIIEFCKKRNVKNESYKNPIYGDEQIQSIRSGHCGQYCILFLNIAYKKKGSSKDKLKYMQNIFR